VLIWGLSFLAVSALWFGAWWFLIKKVDLFLSPDISVLRYDVLVGPIFIGSIQQLWRFVWLASGIFILNNVLLLIASRYARFYAIILVIFTFVIEILLNISFFLLLYLNLKQ
jgi:hypothetical protein